MNLSEFKAFVEGIEHAFGNEAPSPEQWQFIKDKLHQVDQGSSPGPQKRDFTKELDDITRKVERHPYPHITAPMYGTVWGGQGD